jgi:hypothetical protein
VEFMRNDSLHPPPSTLLLSRIFSVTSYDGSILPTSRLSFQLFPLTGYTSFIHTLEYVIIVL